MPNGRMRVLGALAIGAACGCGGQSDPSDRMDSAASASLRTVGDDSATAAAVICAAPDLCFRDTARGRSLDYEPAWIVDAHWLLFGAAGDSIELYGTVAGRS